jgi:hypothetical protein
MINHIAILIMAVLATAFYFIPRLGFEFGKSQFQSLTRRSRDWHPIRSLFAVLPQGFLGPGSGKVGGGIMSKWKGIPYVKGYVKPANPNTSAQQVQRSRMSACVALGQQLYSLVIQEYFAPLAVKMSGFNAFVKYNVQQLAASTYYLTTDNVMSVGSLITAAVDGAALAANTVTVTWDDSIIGNGLATDVVDLIVINKETNAIYVTQDTYARDDGTGTVDCGSESDESKLIAFAICKRGTGTSFTVSNSSSFQVTA